MSCNYMNVNSLTYADSSSSTERKIESTTKQVEVYAFLDPLSERSWSLEPYFKKFYLEYGDYIILRPVISCQLSVLTEKHLKKLKEVWRNANQEKHFLMRDNSPDNSVVLFPWVALAIKAAELQGKNSGRKFLRSIQEKYFLEKKNILCESVLVDCAKAANLDIGEFKNDLFSTYAKNAYQCDMKVMKEMEVDTSPTLVLFNPTSNEQGIKVPGVHTYKTYVHILKEMLGDQFKERKKVDLINFIRLFRITTSKEVSIVYDWSITTAVQKLKELQIQQVVKLVTNDDGTTYWEYIK